MTRVLRERRKRSWASEELGPPPPSDPRELAALLDAEERLGGIDPFRQLGQLAHLILRRTPTAAADRVG
jgi:hypothetical protein